MNASPRRQGIELLACCLLLLGIAALLASVVQAGSDRNQQCVQNVYQVNNGLLSYVQDYDEVFPVASVWNTPAKLQSVLIPYTASPAVFRCPATGNVAYQNNPALAGNTLTDFPARAATETFRDLQAHADGKRTVGFLDGHVERGGVDQLDPETKCRIRESAVWQALSQYAAAHGGSLPPQQDDTQFRAALAPYISSPDVFLCPDSLQFYVINHAIRGHALNSLGDTSLIETVADPVQHKSGRFTRTYLDGYVLQRGSRGDVLYPDIRNESVQHLKWLGSLLLEYVIFHDEHLPPLNNIGAFQAAVQPYNTFDEGRSLRFFRPPLGGQPYPLNAALSGAWYPTITQPASVAWIRDDNNYGDGLISVGYTDGHAARIQP